MQVTLTYTRPSSRRAMNDQRTREETPRVTAHIVALRDIGPGEEIVHSYVDKDDSLSERHEGLALYGFRCRCNRCTAEAKETRMVAAT